MLEIYEKWPKQVGESFKLELPKHGPGNYTKVVIVGVGGSGIVGDFLNRLSYEFQAKVPMVAVKDIDMPKKLVDKSALVIAVSYSGNTLETLTAVKEAINAKATVKGVTSGGKLKELLGRENTIKVPGGFPPRASFPYLFISAVRILVSEGVLDVKETTLNKASFHLDSVKSRIVNEASELADKLVENQPKIPVLITCRKYYPVVLRGRQELAENAKLVSIAEEVPDAGHNILVGYARSRVDWLVLGAFSGEKRCDTVLESFLEVQGIMNKKIILEGSNIIEKMLDGAWLFGFTSVFVALKKELNPNDISDIKAYRKVLEEKFKQ
ncbi:MAG: SIS domain-containing protein [Desulfurococcales archaeon]|nr:SIS domain-containing protein [Desulfurococcales archaeon]